MTIRPLFSHPCSRCRETRSRTPSCCSPSCRPAKRLASNKKILIFDEPTSGLDYENMKVVSEAINTLRKKGILIFVISHDLEFLSRVATKAVFIENNTVSKRINLKKSDEFETIKRFLLQSEGYEE